MENLRIAARREQSTSAAAVRVTDEVGDMAKELQEVRCQLEKVTLAWESALAREAEQKGELQAVLRDREEMAYSFTAEIETLQQALSDEKLKTKRNWKINCEYLMEQDHVLTEKEEEIQNLQQQLAKLSARTSEDKRATDSPSHLSEVRTIDDVVSGRSSLPHDAVGTGKEVMRDGTSGETTHPVLLVDSIASTTKSRVTAAGHLGEHSMVVTPTAPEPRRGKAPPIAFFSGDDPALLLDDWIPSLERAAQWNGWTSQEKLIQLPGYLMGRALQEWHLLTSDEQKSYSAALDALRSRLDPGNKTMAAQEFRHSLQRPKESVTEFIRRIEKAYLIAYGKDALNNDTRDTLLYGQLYEGLRHELMCGPSVSGSQGYKELCVAAKAEERRLAALNQRQQLKSTDGMITYRQSGLHQSRGAFRDISTENVQAKTSSSQPSTLRKCYNCGKAGHLAATCRQPKRESQGRKGTAKQVQSKLTSAQVPQESHPVTLQDLLYSSSEEESDPKTYSIRIQDSGSAVKCAKVLIQGVPAYGLVDTGADITIIGGSLFQKVATVARLRRRDFKKADKTPHTYNQQTFRLDGRMDLDVTFGERTLNTPVYIKVDAADQLLLSEGTCRQLGIVSYHPAVETWRGGGRASQLSKQHS